MTSARSPDPTHARDGALSQLVLRARRRQRTADALWALSRVALPAAVTLVAVGLVLVRRFGLPPVALWVATVPVPAAVAWAWLRPLPLRALLRRIDAHHRLDDRLGSALEFSAGKPPTDPRAAAIVALVREDAERLASQVDPRPAIPVAVPAPRAGGTITMRAGCVYNQPFSRYHATLRRVPSGHLTFGVQPSRSRVAQEVLICSGRTMRSRSLMGRRPGSL